MEITPQVQDWINTSQNDFAHSLRTQQRRGRELSEKQVAAATRLCSQTHVATPATYSRHLGTVGQTYVLRARLVSSQWSDRAGVTVNKFIANADDELVFFGPKPEFIEVGETLAVEFKVKRHTEFRGQRSTQISHLRDARVIQAEVLETLRRELQEDPVDDGNDVAVASQVLQQFRVQPAAQPVAQPSAVSKPAAQAVQIPVFGSTPFADFAKQLKGGARG